ncbi:hypothetical protein D3C72_1661200 [compost metagenome]
MAALAPGSLLHGFLHVAGHVFKQLHLLRFVQARRYAAPEHPPLGPVACFLAMAQAMGIERPDLLHAPGIEFGPHAGPQAPACEVEPDALVLHGAAAAPGAGQQGIEQGAQQGNAPGLARAQHFFQRLAQLAHFLGRHVLRLVAEDAVDQCHGLGQTRIR